MANEPKNSTKSESKFLGGGPKFNQAGLNTPLPGEHTAEVPPAPKYGGPRVWIGVAVVLVLIGALWLVYANGPGGLQSKGGHAGISMDSRPSDDPDDPSNQ